jgi:ribosomal protein L32
LVIYRQCVNLAITLTYLKGHCRTTLLMNAELENFVEIAIVDGYITDKEKEVLKRKAVAMGFDVDELEMILEGKLYELNKSSMPKVNKCPNCGETISGLSKVCPSCKYVQNTETLRESGTLQESFSSLEKNIYDLKSAPKPSGSSITNAVWLIIITGGIYILYKKLVKKEPLFDRYAIVHERIITETDIKAESMMRKYGADPKIAAAVNELINERDTVIKKRRYADSITAVATFVMIAIIIYVLSLIAKASKENPTQDTPEDKVENFIDQKNIGKAKEVAIGLADGQAKTQYLTKIRDLEIDSLAEAGNYNAALKLVNLIEGDGYGNTEREKKIDAIITKEVTGLIQQNEFKKAKERAELASSLVTYDLNEQIELAEKINK